MTINYQSKIETLKVLLNACQKIGQTTKVKNFFDQKKTKLKIVVDCANGMGAFVLPYVKNIYLKESLNIETLLEVEKEYSEQQSKVNKFTSFLEAQHDLLSQESYVEWIELYANMDGNYPNHPADPMNPNNLIDLQKSIIENQADFGAAFDGDADRVFFVDSSGEMINTELLITIFAKEMLLSKEESSKENSKIENKNIIGSQQKIPELNKAIVTCSSYSRALADTVYKMGAAVIPSQQGHTFIKANMNKYKAVYGAEGSGHHYYGEFGFMDSGAITLCLFIKVLLGTFVENSSSKEIHSGSFDSTQILAGLDSYYFTSGEKNYKLPAALNIEVIKTTLKDFYQLDSSQPNLKPIIDETDGISIHFTGWKLTVRGSNTEPLIRINVETVQKDTTKEKLSQILSVIGI